MNVVYFIKIAQASTGAPVKDKEYRNITETL